MISLSEYCKYGFDSFDNKAFIVIKPGFVDKASAILDIFKKNNYVVERMRSKRLTLQEARRLYSPHKKEDFYNNLCKYMSSDICIGVMLHCDTDDIIKKTNDIKDNIREKYGESDMRNVMHSSDSIDNMSRESKIFF